MHVYHTKHRVVWIQNGNVPTGKKLGGSMLKRKPQWRGKPGHCHHLECRRLWLRSVDGSVSSLFVVDVCSPSYDLQGNLFTKRWFNPMTDPWDDCIFTYIYHKNHLNVGKYTSPMDHLGMNTVDGSEILKTPERNRRYCTTWICLRCVFFYGFCYGKSPLKNNHLGERFFFPSILLCDSK